MGMRKALLIAVGALAFLGTVFAFQRPFRQYQGVEYRSFELPPDYQEKSEWVFARLMYPPGPNDGYRGRFDGDWREGLSIWTQDYPRADRHFFGSSSAALTRIHVRSVEQPVNLDDGDDVYNWPWLYAVQVGEWRLTDAQAQDHARVSAARRFLHGRRFLGHFRMGRCFRTACGRFFRIGRVVEIPDNDPIFHTVYDLDDRYQVPGLRASAIAATRTMARVAHWRGIYDDKGRIMVAISFNSDLGDSWEWADAPEYPEKFSALGIRIGVNYIIYAMTH